MKIISCQASRLRRFHADVHVLNQNLNTNTSGNVPPCKFLYKDASSCSQGDEYFGSSVFPSLPLTINWLRNCAKENPSSRIQVKNTCNVDIIDNLVATLHHRSNARNNHSLHSHGSLNKKTVIYAHFNFLKIRQSNS